MDLKKAGCKKQGHCYSKREEAACFFASCFLQPIVWTLFWRVNYRPMFSKREYWVQIDWATVLPPIYLQLIFDISVLCLFTKYNTVAQSICTHYSRFENMGWFATLKKHWVQNMGCKKQQARLLLLFLNNDDPVFGPNFFKGSDLKKYQVDHIS